VYPLELTNPSCNYFTWLSWLCD